MRVRSASSSFPWTIAARRLPLAAVPAALIALAGCTAAPPGDAAPDTSSAAQSSPPPPVERPFLTTDREEYRVERTADSLTLHIVATLTNHAAQPVYLHPCGRTQPSFVLEKWVDGAWKNAYSQACPAMLMIDPPRVEPGASRTDTAHVNAARDPNTMPRFEVEPIAGDYRLVYTQAYASWKPGEGPGELLPLEQRVSRAFRIIE
jgi:hypothetical protein